MYQFVTSDHKPIMTSFGGIQLSGGTQSDQSMHKAMCFHDWSIIDENIIFNYQSSLDNLLFTVPLPHTYMTDNVLYENDNHVLIDGYYNNVMQCISYACNACIPFKLYRINSGYDIPGWNPIQSNEVRRAQVEPLCPHLQQQ